MSERSIVVVVFAAVAFVTALLPASIVAGLVRDASFLVLPVLSAIFAGLWSAILGHGVDHSSKYGYPRGLAVVVFSFVCTVVVFAAFRPMPYQQAVVALLLTGFGFVVFPGFVGGFVAVWFLRYFGHEPNSTVERDTPQAARPSQ